MFYYFGIQKPTVVQNLVHLSNWQRFFLSLSLIFFAPPPPLLFVLVILNMFSHTHSHKQSDLVMSALSPPLSSAATSCSIDHNRIEVLTSATIEGTLWCVSPFVQSLPCLAYYEQTRVKFILFSIVFQCLLFKEGRALQFSILFPCFISLAKGKLIKLFFTTNETMMMMIILMFFFSSHALEWRYLLKNK